MFFYYIALITSKCYQNIIFQNSSINVGYSSLIWGWHHFSKKAYHLTRVSLSKTCQCTVLRFKTASLILFFTGGKFPELTTKHIFRFITNMYITKTVKMCDRWAEQKEASISLPVCHQLWVNLPLFWSTG